MGMGRATPPELERLHSALQQKEEQLASFQETITELEATRNRSPPPSPLLLALPLINNVRWRCGRPAILVKYWSAQVLWP